MTIVRVGSTQKFSQGWDKAFGKKRRTKKVSASKRSAAKARKSSGKAKKKTKK